MGKHAKYGRKYKKTWESLEWTKGWLQEADSHLNEKNLNEAYCKICKTSLRAHIGDLKKHSLTRMHISKMSSVNTKKKISNYGVISLTRQQKLMDMKLAVHIAHHSAVRAMDHLGEVLKTVGIGSNLENLRLHHTKCTSIINNVIAPAMLEELIADVGSNKYSIILDESTDVSVVKYMALCVRYFSASQSEIITDFLGLIEIYQATAQNIYNNFVEYINKIHLPLNNLVAIGTDGASNLCGKNNSFFTLLKQDIPHLILIKCTCHSINLCTSKASEELPRSLDFLAREIYSWFSCSSLRRRQYKDIFDSINIGENKIFYNFVKLSTTRWLVRYEVIKKLLDQWLELKCFFDMVCLKEKCFTAQIIKDLLNDDSNRIYFIFLKPILAETNKLNINFQSNACDVGTGYSDMYLLVLSLARRILKPIFLVERDNSDNYLRQISEAVNNDLAYLPLASVDFGIEFTTEIENSCIKKDQKLIIQQRCQKFILKLLQEMLNRLPENMKLFKDIKLLNPRYCLNVTRDSFAKLPFKFSNFNSNIENVENEWCNLILVDWAVESKGEIPCNVLKFWPIVFNYKDASDRRTFENLARSVLNILILPISNAVVERVFSVMNVTKNKMRNRMKLYTLESMLRIKIHMNTRKQCCRDFTPNDSMYALFTSSVMYENTSEATASSDQVQGQLSITEIENIFEEAAM